MKKHILAAVGAVALTLGLTACSATEDDKLTISLVPSTEGEDLAEALGPLTDYLSEQMGVEVEGVVASDYAATVEALGAGQSDAIITDAGSLYNAMEQHNAELILRDVRFGATSYSSVAYTNTPDKYCEDEPTLATYAAADTEMAYCNGIEPGDTATGEGPAAVEQLGKITGDTSVVLQSSTSPAGYQYPVVAMEEEGVNIDDVNQIPVEGNNNAVLALANGDGEVAFGFWDARSSVIEENPDVATDVVAFAYTEQIPNGGVAVRSDLDTELKDKLTEAMDSYAESSDEAASVMYDLVGLSDWTADTQEEDINRYGEILEYFSK